MLAGHSPFEQMGNSKGHGRRSSFIELRFPRDSDHEGMNKRGENTTNREPEREVSITRGRKAEEARKDQQKEKRD